jgi:oligopeptide/dipeptide ABC transporter ATP-binding protein
MSDLLVKIRGVNVRFETPRGRLHAVRDVDLNIRKHETLAIVGESGAGKSVLGKSILRQHQPPFTPNRVDINGVIRFHASDGEVDLLSCGYPRLRLARARDIATISQEALSGLNPVISIGAQIAEAARAVNPHLTRKQARKMAVDLISSVGIDDAPRRAGSYAHQLSGGQRQRVVIAIAAIRSPRLLIADEPTTALDVTVQARILSLLHRLQQDSGMSILFITHDLGVVSQIADRVAVMYAGRIVEQAAVDDLLYQPRHPYTAGLLATIPGFITQYPALTGYAPEPFKIPSGCAFHPRCPRAMERCRHLPPMSRKGAGLLQCWNPVS